MNHPDDHLFFEKIVAHVQKRVPLQQHEKELFISLLKYRQLLPRQYLLQGGELCRYESYVATGSLRAFLIDKQGQEHTLHFAIDDWWISDLASFLYELPSETHIQALEETHVLQIDKANLERLYQEVPVFERFFRILHQQAYIAQNQRILNNISLTGEERYYAFIKKYPTLVNRIPQKHIASYLGITPVFLSQIRKKATTGK